MLFKLEKKFQPKNYKNIIKKLNNKNLENLVFKWLAELKYKISFKSLEKQIDAILEILKIKGEEKTKIILSKAIANRYGTFIFQEQKIKKINWEVKIKKIKNNKIKI